MEITLKAIGWAIAGVLLVYLLAFGLLFLIPMLGLGYMLGPLARTLLGYFLAVTAGVVVAIAILAYMKRMQVKVIGFLTVTIILCSSPMFYLGYVYDHQGLGKTFTRYEKLEYTSADAIVDIDGNFTIRLNLENTGTTSLTTQDLFINGTLWSELDDGISENVTGLLFPRTNTDPYCEIRLRRGNTWVSDRSIILLITTVAGKEYPKEITLP